MVGRWSPNQERNRHVEVCHTIEPLRSDPGAWDGDSADPVAPVAAILQDAKQGLLELMVSTGVQVFEAMLGQYREALCGPRWQRQPERSTVRGGSTRSEVTIGGVASRFAGREFVASGSFRCRASLGRRDGIRSTSERSKRSRSGCRAATTAVRWKRCRATWRSVGIAERRVEALCNAVGRAARRVDGTSPR